MDFKFKEKHYKKTRFGTKSEAEMSDFKKDNITNDLDRDILISTDFIDSNFQVVKKNDSIKLPEKNKSLHIRTQSQMNFFAFFLMFIEEFGYIDFLSIQTYTFNGKTVLALSELLKQGKIKKLQIVMTETASFRIPKIYKMLKELFSENKNCNLVFYWIHSKVNLVHCGLNKFILDGSGNFSMNAQVEHYNIFNSESFFYSELKWQNDFFFSKKLRKNHEIYKNF